MKVQVLRYDEHWGAHKCRFEDGDEAYIDLLVSGDLDAESHDTLVGKTVEFDRTHPFILIAHRVRVVGEA
ncbi:hypothetical protein KTD19_30815 [Burkholderia multivorans]|jgi:hypothetical protein|uniref:hypothetical protein n=1 Tax=Burkholderia multivorans TaxID=87883 RepID=UPI001C2263AA|nr:hypothetical protein [Burkholderia multivorans]MBU9236753.1 hypothetical protein [Burkholderia multivorans]MBU9420605.1 hypothetical protein [Burkholderia multivorans]